MEKLQTQSATLRKLNTPSDDPVSAAKILEIRTDKVNNEQYIMNAKMAESYLNNSDHALSEMADILVRAKEIALGQSSGASSNEDTRLGVVEEVNQLFQQSVAAANRRVGERYIFGGYKTQRPPVDGDGKYTGDDGQSLVEIAKDVFLSINVPGNEAFNSRPQAPANSLTPATDAANRTPASQNEEVEENVNVFNELQNLRIGLLTGDLNTIHGTLERLDQAHARVIAVRAKIGARLQGLQSTSQAVERHNLTNANLSSTLEDADMAQVVSDLAKEETVFKSSLSSSQKLIQPTLLEFLK